LQNGKTNTILRYSLSESTTHYSSCYARTMEGYSEPERKHSISWARQSRMLWNFEFSPAVSQSFIRAHEATLIRNWARETIAVSAYRFAMDQTTQVIITRARYFRNLIVSVVALALALIGWAAVTRTFRPLAALFLLPPACGLFFLLDGKLLHNWRSHLLDPWIRREIDFQAFYKAITAVPNLPKDTLQSMLATLPHAPDLIAEHGIPPSTREAVAAAVEDIYACQSDVLALKAAASAIVAVSGGIAVACRTWSALFGILAFILLPLLRMEQKRRRLQILKERTAAAWQKSDFRASKYLELVGSLQWDPISASERNGVAEDLSRLSIGPTAERDSL
jgi:hypothetical protein